MKFQKFFVEKFYFQFSKKKMIKKEEKKKTEESQIREIMTSSEYRNLGSKIQKALFLKEKLNLSFRKLEEIIGIPKSTIQRGSKALQEERLIG